MQSAGEHHSFYCGNITIRAGISQGYCTDLHIHRQDFMTAVWYRDEVQNPIVNLYIAAIGPSFTLLYNNGCPSRTDIIDVFLESEKTVRIAWPVYQLDLNPIENPWGILDHAVCRHLSPPVKKKSLVFRNCPTEERAITELCCG